MAFCGPGNGILTGFQIMGKRALGNGIYDRCFNSDGSRTNIPLESTSRYLVICHYASERVRYPNGRSRCFPTLNGVAGAKGWKHSQDEANKHWDNPDYFDRMQLEKLRGKSVYDLFMYYIHQVKPKIDDFHVIYSVAAKWIGSQPLLEAKKHMWERFFEERKHDTYQRKGWKADRQMTARGVSRERTLLQSVYNTAIKYNWWEVCHKLTNPLDGIRIAGSERKKTRTLLPGEEEKLVAAFEKCYGLNKYYVPLAMYLALETGMRLDEIVGLRWSDIDYERRRITIRESKTDKARSEQGYGPGRTIVLTVGAMLYLSSLWRQLVNHGHLPGGLVIPDRLNPLANPDSHILVGRNGKPKSPAGLSDNFDDAARNAKLEPDPRTGEKLTFRDLRRAATDMFLQARLGLEERDLMLGHANETVDSTYSNSAVGLDFVLSKIQDDLDKHVLKRFVMDENNRPKLDEDGKPIEYGVTLLQYAQLTEGRKVTNTDIFKNGLELPHITRWAKTRSNVQRAARSEREANKPNKQFDILGLSNPEG